VPLGGGATATALGREIGIDVEAIRVIRDADDIAARFFSRCEHEAYRALDRRDRPPGFFNCGTRKEAFIKAVGDGLHHPLDSFDGPLAPGEPAKILSSVVTENRKDRFSSTASSSRTARPATMP
jgi:4'-phosphopantetheinyl transferase